MFWSNNKLYISQKPLDLSALEKSQRKEQYSHLSLQGKMLNSLCQPEYIFLREEYYDQQIYRLFGKEAGQLIIDRAQLLNILSVGDCALNGWVNLDYIASDSGYWFQSIVNFDWSEGWAIKPSSSDLEELNDILLDYGESIAASFEYLLSDKYAITARSFWEIIDSNNLD